MDICVWDKCNNRCLMCTNPDRPWPNWDGSFFIVSAVLEIKNRQEAEPDMLDLIYPIDYPVDDWAGMLAALGNDKIASTMAAWPFKAATHNAFPRLSSPVAGKLAAYWDDKIVSTMVAWPL